MEWPYSVDTFFTESVQLTECHNHAPMECIENSTVVNRIDQNQTQWQILFIISSLMNGLLFIVVTGELLFFKKNNISK